MRYRNVCPEEFLRPDSLALGAWFCARPHASTRNVIAWPFRRAVLVG